MSAIRSAAGVAGAVLVLSGVAGAAGCAGGAASNGSSTSGGGGVKAAVAGAAAASPSGELRATLAPPGALSADAVAHAPAQAGSRGAQLPPQVIKSADLVVRVGHGRFDTAMRRVRDIAARYGGFVGGSRSAGTATHTGTVTLRVPAAAFGRALTALEGVGTQTSESVSGQDVTRQVVDLHARLVNLTAQERVLQRLMDRAQTIAESIRVESYLQNVEFQIEDVQGRMLYLRDRTAMSTIAVVVHEAKAKAVPAHHASGLWQAGARSAHAASAVATAVIVGAGFVVPVALLALVALVVGRRLAPFASRLAAGRRTAAGPQAEA
jgi:Domain of unknown function (DUF4349)